MTSRLIRDIQYVCRAWAVRRCAGASHTCRATVKRGENDATKATEGGTATWRGDSDGNSMCNVVHANGGRQERTVTVLQVCEASALCIQRWRYSACLSPTRAATVVGDCACHIGRKNPQFEADCYNSDMICMRCTKKNPWNLAILLSLIRTST